MSAEHVEHLLVGGGIAAAACAQELRARGAEGRVLLATREADPPYHRPPATKRYLAGHEDREATLVLPADWYAEHGVELATRTSVMKLDPAARTAKLQGGREVSYGRALVATGAMVQRLPLEGQELDGLHYLRALGNADAVRRDAEGASRAVLVGGSFIGCEVAATLTGLGLACTVVMQEEEPMERGFGRAVGRRVRAELEARGVEVLGGRAVARFEGDGTGDGDRVRRVVLEDGAALPADLVVLGTGARPDVMLARSSGLELGETGGVRCDAALATSAPGVWAAGDMCEWEHEALGRRLRVEHEDVAQRQGAHAAAAMHGDAGPFVSVPWFWTDLADWLTVEAVGAAGRWDREVVRGDLDGGAFSVLQLAGDRLVGLVASGRRKDVKAAAAVLGAGGRLAGDDPGRYADPDVELEPPV